MKKKILLLSVLLTLVFSCKKEKKEDLKDTTRPIITLIGNANTQVEFGTLFIDSGYTASDDFDGDITSKVIVTGNVNQSIQGVYKLKYNVTDSAGNKAVEKIRTIVYHRSLKPQNKQNGFALTQTATWCHHCGNWGAPLIHKYAEDTPKGVILAAHLTTDDPMTNHLSSSISYDRSYMGAIPSFYVADTKTSDQLAMINFLSINSISSCGIDYNYFISNDSMYVETKTKFFNSESGDFYLSVLVLEDGIDGSSAAAPAYQQVGTSTSYPNDDYTHDFVMRASAITDSAYGEIIISNPNSNQEINKEYVIAIDSKWKNPYPVCIIWKYAAGTKPEYHFMNSLKRKNP